MLALPTVVWAGVLFGIVVYLGTMQLEEDSDAGLNMYIKIRRVYQIVPGRAGGGSF